MESICNLSFNQTYIVPIVRVKSTEQNFFILYHKRIQNEFVNIKVKQNNHSKPGIYEINCDKCTAQYIGQTKSNIKHFKEHVHI